MISEVKFEVIWEIRLGVKFEVIPEVSLGLFRSKVGSEVEVKVRSQVGRDFRSEVGRKKNAISGTNLGEQWAVISEVKLAVISEIILE